MTLEHGKTHCGPGLITDRIVHIVKEEDVDLWSKSAVSETIALSDAYSYYFGSHCQLDKEIKSQVIVYRSNVRLLLC